MGDFHLLNKKLLSWVLQGALASAFILCTSVFFFENGFTKSNCLELAFQTLYGIREGVLQHLCLL